MSKSKAKAKVTAVKEQALLDPAAYDKASKVIDGKLFDGLAVMAAESDADTAEITLSWVDEKAEKRVAAKYIPEVIVRVRAPK